MAIEVSDLKDYNIITLGEYKLKITTGGFGYGDDKLFFFLFPEDKTLEEIEAILKNPKNTKRIIVSDKEEQNIFAILENYCNISNIEKLYNYAYYKHFDSSGNLIEAYTDLYKIKLSRSTVPGQLNQVQSDLEYIAILSDIDLDENF